MSAHLPPLHSAADEAFARARLRAVVLEGVRQHGPIRFSQIRRRIAPNVGHGPVDRALKALREQGVIKPSPDGWVAVAVPIVPPAPSTD
jgi:hypothetical protein